MYAENTQKYAGSVTGAIPHQTSEVEAELNALRDSVERLCGLRMELSARISCVSRGVPPRAESKSSAPQAALGSSMARQLEELRGHIDGISGSISDELSALAI